MHEDGVGVASRRGAATSHWRSRSLLGGSMTEQTKRVRSAMAGKPSQPAPHTPQPLANLFDTIAEMGHEQLVVCHDKSSGYRGIIAIHDTTLGPALGGTRFWSYDSDEAAIIDALRLARGMTYKNAVAGLNLGGGKSVIIG